MSKHQILYTQIETILGKTANVAFTKSLPGKIVKKLVVPQKSIGKKGRGVRSFTVSF